MMLAGIGHVMSLMDITARHLAFSDLPAESVMVQLRQRMIIGLQINGWLTG